MTSINLNDQIETVSTASVITRMKKPALLATAVAALGVAGFYGYKMYKGAKVVVDVVVAESTDTPAEETVAAE